MEFVEGIRKKVEKATSGKFDIKMDKKGRVSLPSGLRSTFSNAGVVITNSVYRKKRCIDILPLEEWQRLEERYQRLGKKNEKAQVFHRFYMLGSHQIEIDGQGRMMVPQSLRKFADLDSECVLLAMDSKLELWNFKTWDKLFNELAEDFDISADALEEDVA